MADVITGVTEIAATQREIIQSLVQRELIERSILVPTITDWSRFVAPGSKNVQGPRAGSLTVNDKAENTAVDAQALTYATDTLALDKHKVIQTLTEDIAEVQSSVNVMEDYAARAGRALALQVDEDILTQLRLASSATPDHIVQFANTPTNTVQKTDILEARRLLGDVGGIPEEDRYMLISPAQEKAMLLIDDFIHVDKYGPMAQRALHNAELGRAYGFTVLVSSIVEDDELHFWHKEACAIAFQIAPKFEVDRDLPHLADRMSISHLYGTKVLNEGKMQVLFNDTGA